MFRSKRSRIGLAIALSGSLWAGVSVYLGNQVKDPKWVFGEPSSEPSIQTDEIWHVSGICLKKHLEKATEEVMAKLKSHNENMPNEVRAWINRPPPRTRTPPPPDERPIDRLRREYEESKFEFGEKRYFLTLQSKYIKWFAAKANLEEDVKQRLGQLGRVKNEEIVGGTLRKGTHAIEDATNLLGLAIFPDEELKAVKESCLQIIPIKTILSRHTYKNLWRLQIDHVTAFSFGAALMIFGFFLIRN
jgi:hypothetical protein